MYFNIIEIVYKKFFSPSMLVSIFLFSICTHSFSKPATIILNDQKQEYFVVRKYAEYYEDKEKNKKIEDIISNVPFEIISDNKIDFTNKNINSAYWLHFYVLNNTTDLTDFIIEMYDYDINEINIYTKTKNGTFSERKSGLDLPFQTRDFEHKNICFKLPITLKDTTEVYMRLYSTTLNVFEPVIKTQEYFYAYSLKEYVLLGVFYGFMVLIILYNFISFLILRIRYYIYYVIYTIGISIYLMSKNGTGFQYLWPNNPNLNVHIDTLSIAVSIIFLSFFTMEFLQIKNKQSYIYKLFLIIICIELSVVVLKTFYFSMPTFILFNILAIQFCLWVGLNKYKNGNKSAKWFVCSFIILNIFFLIFGLEYLNWLPSSIFTVYALNIGVILQFIFLSIGITESIKNSEREKHKTHLELITTREKNASMRLIELKKQMNPHFIFNALNSILERILTDKKEQAVDFLTRFSKLIRDTLNYSEQVFIPLSDELTFIENYLFIEQMRLGTSFTYTIGFPTNMETDDIEFPSFIIQPFVENAIWHGLMPKTGNKSLRINVYLEGKILHVQIIDNGVGRKMIHQEKKVHKSKGISIVRERLKLIELTYHLKTDLHISDLYDDNNNPCGTIAHIKIETSYE